MFPNLLSTPPFPLTVREVAPYGSLALKTGLCYACLPHVTPESPPEANTLCDDEMQPGQIAYAACHGCGWGLFDRLGQRVALPRTCLNCAAEKGEFRQGAPVCAACGGMMIPTLAS